MWQYLAPVILAGSLCFASFEFGREYERGKQAQVLATQQSEAAQQLQAKNVQIHKQAQEHADEIRSINARLSDALERLRKRPERMPEPARAACAGATGGELSAEDAGFLVREAARADGLRSALSECYAWIDTVSSN